MQTVRPGINTGTYRGVEISLLQDFNMNGSRLSFANKTEVMESKCGVVEFQAFRGNDDKFIVKELVFLDMETSVVYQFMFKPPMPFKRLTTKAKVTNKWMMNHFHNLRWGEGFTSYNMLGHIMNHFCNKFTTIYTRGLEKSKFIQNFTNRKVFDVLVDREFQGHITDVCISSTNLRHQHSQCALKNAYRLASFVQHYKSSGGGSGEGSGGGSGGYKYDNATVTMNQYYSGLGRDNTSDYYYLTEEEDGIIIPTISPNFGAAI